MNKKFKEAQGLNNVARFHRLFALPVLSEPQIPDANRCELRINLLQEEINELKEAIEANDLIEIADALCDIQYVLSGAILEFGLADKFSDLFDEVQRSNLSKTCQNEKIAIETQAYYKNVKDTDSFITEREGEFLVYRSSDKKVLKSIDYSPANLASILNT